MHADSSRREHADLRRSFSIASSAYSDFDSYKPALQRSNSKQSTGETVVTGSIRSEQPALRDAADSIAQLGTSAPSIYVSKASDDGHSDAGSVLSEADSVGPLIRPQMVRAARVKSQIATVSRWSDASANKPGGDEEDGGASWSRAPSMASNGSRSSRATSSARSSRRGRSVSPSAGGRAPAVPSLTAGSTIDLRETLQSPSRDSEISLEPSRMERGSKDERRAAEDSQEEETVAGDSRDSTASGVSSTSTVRRFRKIVNQLDFGDVSRWVLAPFWLPRAPLMVPRHDSSPTTLGDKSWSQQQRQSSKSSRSTRTTRSTAIVPPSPVGSSMGFAM